eukprot:g33231.t1
MPMQTLYGLEQDLRAAGVGRRHLLPVAVKVVSDHCSHFLEVCARCPGICLLSYILEHCHVPGVFERVQQPYKAGYWGQEIPTATMARADNEVMVIDGEEPGEWEEEDQCEDIEKEGTDVVHISFN